MKSYMFRKDSVTSHSSCRKLQKSLRNRSKNFQSVPETFYPVTIHILRSRVFLKSRIIYMFYNRLFLQPVRDLDGILLGPLHADSESLDAS